MKHVFMNKENGKIASVLVMYLDDEGHMQTDSYDKVEDLLADYAAYERAPKEPLIKDEKIRKAVRAWAEANGVFEVSAYKPYIDSHCWYIRTFNDNEQGIDIDFWGKIPEGLIDRKRYTIDELCGEEEE